MVFLVCVGACYMDTVLTVPHYPAEDEKLRALNVTQRRGGNCPNTLEVLQQLVDLHPDARMNLALLSALPASDSPATQRIRSSLSSRVDLSHCFFREEHDEAASSYIIRSTETDSRTIVNSNALPEMTAAEFKAAADKLGDKAIFYHFEGRIPDVSLECVKYLRQHYPKARISVEVEKPGRVGLEGIARLADVIFFSKSWAEAKGYQGAQQCIEREAPKYDEGSILCCTWGKQGAVAWQVGERMWEATNAFQLPGRRVIDTVGAGDTFIAGMLYALTLHNTKWQLFRKLRFANELAGRKVVQEGFAGLATQMIPVLRKKPRDASFTGASPSDWADSVVSTLSAADRKL